MSTATQDKELAEQRLSAAISLVSKIAEGDWPYADSKAALISIRSLFEGRLESIKALDQAGDDIIKSWCGDARALVARYHSFVGAILRSSNVRNAFESFSPIRSLAASLLGPDCKIILSSEWSYVPFVYPIPMEGLEDYVFIGLPASEAQNALLLPLAGHEIGHAVWRKGDFTRTIRDRVREEIIQIFLSISTDQDDLFPATTTRADLEKDFRLQTIWKRPYEIARLQCEEVFCDILACWIFGEGFLHSFRYMLAPEIAPRSGEFYPSNRARASYLSAAAQRFHGSSFQLERLFDFEKRFPNSRQDLTSEVKRADDATAAVVPLIMDEVDKLCRDVGLRKPTPFKTTEALNSLRNVRPPVEIDTVADVINAAWELRMDLNGWAIPGVEPERKLKILSDLVFKSFEVKELHERDEASK